MYSIAVKVDDIEKRRRSAGLLHVVLGFFLVAKGADYFKFIEYRSFLPVVPVLLIASLSLFYGFFRKKLDAGSRLNGRLRLLQLFTFLVLGIVFLMADRALDYIVLFVFAIFCLILFFSERKIFEETNIILDDEGLIIPGSYKEHRVMWVELSEVIIREDFITIFHVKKKYLQFQVLQDLSTLEVAKMNAFCREKLEAIDHRDLAS